MNLLKKIPFFLFLLVLFFCLHGSVENYGYLNANEVLQVAAVILGCMAVFFVLTWFISKNYLFTSLVIFFIAGWYLFLAPCTMLLKPPRF